MVVTGSSPQWATLDRDLVAVDLPPVDSPVTTSTASSFSEKSSWVTGAQLSGEHWVVFYAPCCLPQPVDDNAVAYIPFCRIMF